MVPEFQELTGSAMIAEFFRAFSLDWNFVLQLHGYLIRSGLSQDPSFGNPLINLYCKRGLINSACSIFQELSSCNSVTWVAILSGFSLLGLGDEALKLFSQILWSSSSLTPYVFSSAIGACTGGELFTGGVCLHGQSWKWGFSRETFVCNALINFYSELSDISSAQQIFDEMPQRDRITYNSLISAYSQEGKTWKTLFLFKEMQELGFQPDAVTIAGVSSGGDLLHGIQLHGFVIKAGLFSDIIIHGSLMDLYVKCDDEVSASKIFFSDVGDNIVLCNLMLVAYGRSGDLQRSFNLFQRMRITGISPNQFTFPTLIRTCITSDAMYSGKELHALAIKSGFELSRHLSSILVELYSNTGEFSAANQILREIPSLDLISWTSMIAGYTRHGLFSQALSTFREALCHGLRPDSVILAGGITACTGILAIRLAFQIHAHTISRGYWGEISITNALITFYARSGRNSDAFAVFSSSSKDEITWNSLIAGLSQSGSSIEAIKMFVRMRREGWKLNLYASGAAAAAAGDLAGMKLARQIHCKMTNSGLDVRTEGANALISLYSKCGSIKDAESIFYSSPEKNLISFNAMIAGYSQHGRGVMALQLFQHMKELKMDPSQATFTAVLSACSHEGLVEEGVLVFESMAAEHRICPAPEHYASLIDILGRGGEINRAVRFISEMEKPDSMVWKTLLGACRVYKNLEIGEMAAQKVLELDERDPAAYVLLSNIYEGKGMSNCRDRVRKMMREKGVKKEPGQSWIEVGNRLHLFLAGDREHLGVEEIYEFLEGLNEKMGKESEDRERGVHSEKLAVAFGLMSSEEMEIRVMKNLRVCSDCHEWMKLLSRVTGRLVILRDVYRFHHFKEGSCSCRDYW